MKNRRRRRTALWLALSAAGLIGCGPPQEPAPVVEWEVDLSDPETGLVVVRATFPAAVSNGQASLELRFRDLRRHPEALRSFGARAARGPAVVTAEGAAQRVELTDSSGAVVVEYTVDPTFYPPGGGPERPSDARSRVTSDLAILRTASVFPAVDSAGFAWRVRFDLPEGWVAVVPWPKAGDGYRVVPESQESVEYLGFGPLDVHAAGGRGSPITIASAPGADGVAAGDVASIVRDIERRLGVVDAGRRVAIVVPQRFMRGGAAGRHTIVQSPHPATLVHEIFHWWNHGGLVEVDARWFVEGLTEYYGLTLAEAGGLLTPDEAVACLADLNAEMRNLERDGGVGLATASRRSGQEARASRLLYSKGALFALLLQRGLDRRGASLDSAMKVVVTETETPLGNGDLYDVFAAMFGPEVSRLFDQHVLGDEPLPDLGLPPPTGTSGCARYLPR